MFNEVSHNDLITHIDRLVNEFDLKVTTAYDPCKSYARRSVRTICIPYIVDIETYYTCLHEIAHCVYGKAWYGTTLDTECYAWRWSYDNSIIDADEKCKKMVENSLIGYYSYAKGDKRFRYNVDLFTDTILLINGLKESKQYHQKEAETAQISKVEAA